MKLHDGNCKEFNINHVPADKANPTIWGIHRGVRLNVSPASPVSGWRYTGILHIGGKVIYADGFGEGPELWEGMITTPRAECDDSVSTLGGPGGFQTMVHRVVTHGPSPDPSCQCGYRIVKSMTELSRYMRDTRGGFDDFDVSRLPDHIRSQVEHLGDTIHQSLVATNVLGCGGVTAQTPQAYHDPEDTVCVEFMSTDGWVIANEGDPVIDALVDWGAQVCVVPEVNDVHEAGECAKFKADLELWRMDAPASVDAVLEHGSVPEHPDFPTVETRRQGAHGAAGVAVIDSGKVLMVRADGRWSLPGGALQEGETAGEGAVREVLEETGVDLAGVPVREAFVRSDGSGWSYTTIVTEPFRLETVPVPLAEISLVGWFDTPPLGTNVDLVDTWDRIIAP